VQDAPTEVESTVAKQEDLGGAAQAISESEEIDSEPSLSDAVEAKLPESGISDA